MTNDHLLDSIGFRSIKILDIGYVTILYALLGLIVARLSDVFLGSFDPEIADKNPFIWEIIKYVFFVYIIGVFAYFARNIVKAIPYPLNGYKYGNIIYDHNRIKELENMTVFYLMAFTFQVNFTNRTKYILDKFSISTLF